MTDSASCPWWVRWYHRRLRRADIEFMKPQLSRIAAGNFATAWEAFIRQPSQTHWHCACAEVELLAKLERALAEPDDAE